MIVIIRLCTDISLIGRLGRLCQIFMAVSSSCGKENFLVLSSVTNLFKAWFHWKFAIAEEIGCTVDPVKIYRLGKSIVTVRAWQREKVDIMLHILRHKWWQCEQFKRELVAFDQCILTENTKNHFWVLVKLEKG